MGSFAEPSNMLSTLGLLHFSDEGKHSTCLQTECTRQMAGKGGKKKHEESEAVALRSQPQQETHNVLHNEVLTEADCTAAVAMSL